MLTTNAAPYVAEDGSVLMLYKSTKDDKDSARSRMSLNAPSRIQPFV
jgi:hypothetical protein